jgi:hypothetical protein
MILEAAVIAIALGLIATNIMRPTKPRSAGTRYLYPVERKIMASHRLVAWEESRSEDHEREFARSMPVFIRFQEIAKSPNLTLADMRARIAGKPAKDRSKIANIRSRRK